MRTSELEGKYTRLRAELAAAYAAPACHVGHIDRLTAELADVELRLQGRHQAPAARGFRADGALPGLPR
ncbi:MAG: hypothetical protein V4540_13375 [Pseudomonadota bacterium]